jgi:hypothetical protein
MESAGPAGIGILARVSLPARQADDHAARLARFAIAAMAAAGEVPVDEEGPDPAARVQIRIGMHCGPVSASVVGTQVQAHVAIMQCVCCAVVSLFSALFPRLFSHYLGVGISSHSTWLYYKPDKIL